MITTSLLLAVALHTAMNDQDASVDTRGTATRYPARVLAHADVRELETALTFVDPTDVWVIGELTDEDGGPPAAPTGDATAPATPFGFAEPFPFIENGGQWPERARFLARAGALDAWAERDGLTLRLRARDGGRERGSVVRLAFEQALDTAPVGVDGLAGVHNYFVGDDPERWATGARAFAALEWPELYAGVDLRLRTAHGRLEYDVLLEPDADLDAVVVRVEGARSVARAPDGSLAIETERGTLGQPAPVTYAVQPNGDLQPIDCHFRVIDGERYGFELPERPEGLEVVIDPGLVWSSYLGGSGFDGPSDGGYVGADGQLIGGGHTSSANFPTTPGAYDLALAGASDAFVYRFAADGTALVFATYFGGNGDDRVRDVDVDASGAITVAGETSSTNLPVTGNAIQSTFGGGYDGCVARLSATGDQLLYCTYLGGNGNDGQNVEFVVGLEVDAAGVMTLAGQTNSANFPTTPGCYDPTFDSTATSVGAYDAFMTRISADGSTLLYSTFLGGSHVEYGYDVALGEGNEIVVVGDTASDNYPTTPGCYDPWYAGQGEDVFVAVFDPAGNGPADLLYSTYFGGDVNDIVFAVDVGPTGEPTLGGWTYSDDLDTTPGAFRESAEANTQHFTCRIAPEGNGAADLVYSSYYGGPQTSTPYVLGFTVYVDVDENDLVTLTGDTSSDAFHVTPCAVDDTYPGIGSMGIYWGDVFVLRLQFTGQGQDDLLYGTYYGGIGHDRGFYLGRMAGDRVGVSVYQLDGDYQTTSGAYQENYGGGSADSAALVIDLVTNCTDPGTPYCLGDGSGTPCPCGNLGDGSLPAAGCANGQYASGAMLGATGIASVTNDTVVLIGEHTEHSQSGLFFQADNDLSPGQIWGDGLRCAGGNLKRLGVRFSDGTGYSDTSAWTTPISVKAGNVAAGDTKYYQLWYRNPAGSPCGSDFNASNGYAVTWLP